MSVFGVDFGTLNSVVGVTRYGGVDIILNEASKRSTPSMVTLGDDERSIGFSANEKYARNLKNTIACFKRFLGMRIDDPDLPQELRFLTCKTTADPQGRIMFEVTYNEEPLQLYPEQVLAMYLTQLNSFVNVEAALDPAHVVEVKDCVLSIPCWFTSEQRVAILRACEIANLNCMTLINETTAASIDYGIFRDATLPESDANAQVVGIVDIGYASTTITFSEFWKGNLRVIRHTWDKHLGTRNFDAALADHFETVVKQKYKIDVSDNKKARLRLLLACEKLKELLSANTTAPLMVENLMDVDINTLYKRSEFEELVTPLLEKLKTLFNRAIAESGLDLSKIAFLELIGGGCRIPCVKQTFQDLFGRPCSFTLNGEESICRGCAITAAVFSPKFRVREFVVNECVLQPVLLGYYSATSEYTSEVPFFPTTEVNKVITLLDKNSKFPKTLELTFNRREPFTLYAFHDNATSNELRKCGYSPVLGKWIVGSTDKKTTGEVKVIFRMAGNGLISIDGAYATEEYEVEVVEERKKEASPKPERTPTTSTPTGKPTEESSGDKDPAPPADTSNPDQKPSPPPPEVEKVTVKKTKHRKVELTVTPQLDGIGLPSESVIKGRKMEESMRRRDAIILRTKHLKNEVESYIYDNRSRLETGGLLHDFVSRENREEFLRVARENEDWLGGEGWDSTAEEYSARLEGMKKFVEPGVKRQKLFDIAPYIAEQAIQKISELKAKLKDKVGKEAHITQEDLEKEMQKCDEAIVWIREEVERLFSKSKHADTDVDPKQFEKRFAEVEAHAKQVMNKPAPPPPKPPTPPAETKEKAPEEEKPASPVGKEPATGSATAATPPSGGPKIDPQLD